MKGYCYGVSKEDVSPAFASVVFSYSESRAQAELGAVCSTWRNTDVTCFGPLSAYKADNGGFVFDRQQAAVYRHVRQGEFLPRYYDVPCSRCIGCRLERSRDWATRVSCEQLFYKQSSFLTLTYSDDNLPKGGSLSFLHLTDFVKRLRFRLDYDFGLKIRYFACGEYGTRLSRPHYHMCLFGSDFAFDRIPVSRSKGGILYSSAYLSKSWSFGHSWIGDLTYHSAAYTARYVVKKMFGEKAQEHYQDLIPEDIRFSLKPGLGARYFDKYWKVVYPNDFVVLPGGRKVPPPRYYDKLLEKKDPDLREKVRVSRVSRMEGLVADYTRERLKVRAELAQLRLSRLTRSYENAEYV